MKNKEPLKTPVRWLTVKDACEYLGVSRTHFQNMTTNAGIAPAKIGTRKLYDIKDIDNWLEKTK